MKNLLHLGRGREFSFLIGTDTMLLMTVDVALATLRVLTGLVVMSEVTVVWLSFDVDKNNCG